MNGCLISRSWLLNPRPLSLDDQARVATRTRRLSMGQQRWSWTQNFAERTCRDAEPNLQKFSLASADTSLRLTLAAAFFQNSGSEAAGALQRSPGIGAKSAVSSHQDADRFASARRFVRQAGWAKAALGGLLCEFAS